jgi:type IX secretion system PorP/SprF family membrane protein
MSLLCKNSGSTVFAQQLPYYSQFKTNMYMLNPGVTGTKRTLDIRMNDRMQWVGYDGAPSTLGFSIHSRFLKGKMGAGMSVVKDQIGPSQQTAIGANYAYHIRFPDVELSLGASGILTKYTLDGSKITLHNTQDPAINMNTSSYDWVPDASFGLYLYNDRFHFGVSALHFIQSKAEFYKNDSTKKGIIKYAAHVNATIGYNYSSNPDYVMENTIYVNYVVGAPVMIDYTVRLHYLSKFFVGASLRLKDAIALHVGATFLDNFQVSYSYDVLMSKLSPYSHGSHEIMLSYSHNLHINKSKFVHQRYAYMF